MREVGRQVDDLPAPGGLAFEHDPLRPRFVSQAAGRLPVRFQVPPGSIQSAVLQADRAYPMALQLAWPEGEMWRAALPVSVYQYQITAVDREGKEQTFGPFQAVSWVAGRVGYQIFPDRFWNGAPPMTGGRALRVLDWYSARA